MPVCLLCLSPEISGRGYAVPTATYKSVVALSPRRGGRGGQDVFIVRQTIPFGMKIHDLERLFCALCAAGQVQDKNWGQVSLSLPLVPAGGHPCWAAWPLEAQVDGPWGIPVPFWQL